MTFLRRLDRATPRSRPLHLILDNLSAHKSPPVCRWLARHPRVHFHLVPTSSSWLNLVERWFLEITRVRIRRGTFTSVPALERAINDYLTQYNETPKPFAWRKDADTILAKIDRCKEALNSRDQWGTRSARRSTVCWPCPGRTTDAIAVQRSPNRRHVSSSKSSRRLDVRHALTA